MNKEIEEIILSTYQNNDKGEVIDFVYKYQNKEIILKDTRPAREYKMTRTNMANNIILLFKKLEFVGFSGFIMYSDDDEYKNKVYIRDTDNILDHEYKRTSALKKALAYYVKTKDDVKRNKKSFVIYEEYKNGVKIYTLRDELNDIKIVFPAGYSSNEDKTYLVKLYKKCILLGKKININFTDNDNLLLSVEGRKPTYIKRCILPKALKKIIL